MALLGLISEAQGLVRQRTGVLARLQHIVHGGDIGRAEVPAQLAAIAPVTAVAATTIKASELSVFPRLS